MVIKEEFRSLFKENGLSDFDDFMNFSGGEVIKKITLRSITKFYLSKDGIQTGFYLKRHSRRLRLHGRLQGLVSSSAKASEAMKEFEASDALGEAGVPAMRAVAYGQENRANRESSFLVTEALDSYTQLEKLVHSFAPPLKTDQILMKRELIIKVGLLVKKLHYAGFNHKDLYLTHILARYDTASGFDLKLIDLQRVERRTTGRRRWLVKDIAALNYSCPTTIITSGDRLRFFKSYTGQATLTREQCAFIKSVQTKTRLIATHTVKMYKRRAERVKKGLLPR